MNKNEFETTKQKWEEEKADLNTKIESKSSENGQLNDNIKRLNESIIELKSTIQILEANKCIRNKNLFKSKLFNSN